MSSIVPFCLLSLKRILIDLMTFAAVVRLGNNFSDPVLLHELDGVHESLLDGDSQILYSDEFLPLTSVQGGGGAASSSSDS